jgi:methyltransferase (TIGR00027 family)
VKEGTASHTARGVAARRLQYDRVAAPYGDPAADEALTRDVADGLTPEHNRMHEYIRGRTAFFDRVVVQVLDRGIAQVVIGGAGYDGRALRYAKPGVRWFEVDHPATQADKLARIARLGIAAPQVTFIPADFTVGPVAGPLLAAGLDPARQALFLFEGVAVYLERRDNERVLTEFREVTPDGSPLAMSVSVGGVSSVTRAAFQERLAALGEPVRTVLTVDETAGLLAGAGWELREPSGRQRSAGLLLARAAASSQTAQSQTASSSYPERIRPAPSARAPVRARKSAGRAPRETPASLPLSALLSKALVAFTVEADNETEHRLAHRTQDYGTAPGAPLGAPWLTSLLMYANCLRHLPDAGITVAELRDRARTGTNLDGMRRWRYVTFTPDPGRGKRPRPDALIRPTGWGIEARDTWQPVTADVESRWRDRLGGDAFGALRAALADVAARLDPRLPDCLPILGYGLNTRRRQGGKDAALAAPLDQAGQADIADLPLWALLSRPLRAFAEQYEAGQGPSLAVSANILRVLTADGVYTKDIGALGGVSKESVAMALGVLRKAGAVVEGPDARASRFKVTRLTADGVALRDEYPPRAAGVERDWRGRFGDAPVTALREALEPLAAGDPPPLSAGLEPYPDGWRARVPRPAVLPHYPMTLHRGGYPDGS